MNAMMDASCPKCGKRFGWHGHVTDRPPCPRCAHQIPRADLEAEAGKIDEFMRLYDTHPKDASPADLAAMRKMSGLTVGQVARQLGLPDRVEPVEWEAGRRRPTVEQCERLSELYGCGEPAAPKPPTE